MSHSLHPPTAGELDAFLAGEATPQVAHRVHQWIAVDPRRSATLEALKSTEPPPAKLGALGARWEEAARTVLRRSDPIARQGGAAGRTHKSGLSLPHHRLASRWLLGASLVVAPLLLVAVLRSTSAPGNEPGVQASATVYRTAPGERKVITLANRTTMILAPATTARITASGIELSGQAWFDVRPSERDPFIVRTASSEVRVLGTSFSVRQYPAELHARVAVVEGKVGMRLLGPATQQPRRVPEFVVLTARMAGESSDSGIVQSRGLSADEASAWTRGRLVFRQASLRDVAAELSRAYGADIRVNDTTLSSQRVTITAQLETQTVAQVLDLLAQALDARCVRTGKAFVLTAGRAPRQLPRAKPLSTPETQYGR